MSILNKSKLNILLRSWPRGTVGLCPFFKRLKISPQLIAVYQKSGWIKRIGDGAYQRFDDNHVYWQGALYAIQQYLNVNIHVGAITALEAYGFAQYISSSGKKAVWLFGKHGTTLPRWFTKTNWKVRIRYHTSNLFEPYTNVHINKREIDGQLLFVSSPERAILEALDFVPREISFEYAKELLESLQTLRPNVVEELLRKCRSVKVKRLFLFLAHYAKLPWVDEIKKNSIDLGSGFRSIAKPGVLDSKYRITIPASFRESNEK